MQLHQTQDLLTQHAITVWIIGFGNLQRLRKWHKKEGFRFPLLYDKNREVYKQYRLEKSILRSWSVRNIWSYITAFFKGRRIHGILGDPHQLGGDFLINKQGEVALAYYSQDPLDRPTLDEIITAARKEDL